MLPYLSITPSGELEYRSDYGITHAIPLSDIHKINKESGVGGYEHALFVYFARGRPGQDRIIKIKTSYFDRSQLIALIGELRQRVPTIHLNDELKAYLDPQ